MNISDMRAQQRGRGRGGSRGGGRGGDDQNRNRDSRDNRDNRYRADVVKERENLERYYNELIQLPEEEKVAFWEALRRELPNSFRFCGSKGYVSPSENTNLVAASQSASTY